MQQYFGKNKEGKKIDLNEKDYNHIKNVMRMCKGEEIFVVFDNKRYICELSEDLTSATIKEELKTKMKKQEIVFYLPFLNDNKMSLIFQKCTELGVTKFIPVEYEHCKYKIDDKTKEKKIIRWNKIIVEACEQSYRNDIPVLENFIKVEDIKSVNGMNILCSLDNKGVKKLNDVLNFKKMCDKISLVFGPEGGLTNEEDKLISSFGFQKTNLGKNILRSETVPLYLISIIKYLEGSE